MKKLTFTDVHMKLVDKEYGEDGKVLNLRERLPEHTVFDENNSVKWNREQLEIENRRIDRHNSYVKKESKKYLFQNDMVSSIANEAALNDKQALKVFKKAIEQAFDKGFIDSELNVLGFGSMSQTEHKGNKNLTDGYGYVIREAELLVSFLNDLKNEG